MPQTPQTTRTPQCLSLRAWRDLRALSLSDLAAAAQVDRQSIYRIEHGHHVPQPRTRHKLADALHIAVDRIDWREDDSGKAATGSL